MVKINEFGVYNSTDGKQKSAMVIGTPETVVEGTSIPVLAEGQVHILVFSLKGKVSPRYNVVAEKTKAGLVFRQPEPEADEDDVEDYDAD